ncbi:MAG: hypothetical protein DRP09_04825 [Candidatus Thorarchaeota archaeon]|nr:MAG: hypothetical protein DRP09_04825 [Candidatus Thorarchaeota archaeon]
MRMVEAFEMLEDGSSSPVVIARADLNSNCVYCIVDEPSKSVYLWIGKEAPVRKRFVGAQTASRIRQEQGSGFRVRSIDQGYEDKNFYDSLNL